MGEENVATCERYCDLVMKGGITSGIVYPTAVCELSKQYRFKSIGGSSAGAIAAVLTAAAEYRREHLGERDGFDLLRKLPGELGRHDRLGRTKLLSLFQPDPSCRRLFRVLVSALNHGTTRSRMAATAAGVACAYWPAVVGAALSAAAVALKVNWLAGVLLLPIVLFVLIALAVYRDIGHKLARNGYGLCKGLNTDRGGEDALIPWLHALIQKTAGRSPKDPPLTFGDLWKWRDKPPGWLASTAQSTPRSIVLQMFTTNLSHGRPYLLPNADQTARLFYNREELEKYLPIDVVEWIEKHARPYERLAHGGDPPVALAEQLGLKELPEPENFPVLLATRLSLSFPLLLAAVPLWSMDFDPLPGKRTFTRCIFSDGGICSNFPVHLFDDLIPMWPTFAIQLEGPYPDRDPTYLPTTYYEGFGERWNRFDEQKSDVARMGGFVGALVGAMQNWNDNTLSRMPGVRDRVVRVRLNDREGGLNLNMPPDLITAISERGDDAAKKLCRRFIRDPANPSVPAWDGWDEHRWVRLDVLLHMLRKRLPRAGVALFDTYPCATPYGTLVSQAAGPQLPPGHKSSLDPSQIGALQATLTAFRSLATTLSYSFPPVPEPELRVRPPV